MFFDPDDPHLGVKTLGLCIAIVALTIFCVVAIPTCRSHASGMTTTLQVEQQNEPAAAAASNQHSAPGETKSSTGQHTTTMKVTAYCLCEECCGIFAKQPMRLTSIGDDATICDGVAADPKLIPYRTRLSIPGIGIREVDDTGGTMRQSARNGISHIDVRFPTHEEACVWGVRWLEVTILGSQT